MGKLAPEATGEEPCREGGAPASEAVGRVGDPVGRLLLGALGGAVAREDGLVRFRLLAVCDGPLQGRTWGLPGFPSTPTSCWKTKTKSVKLELQITPNVRFFVSVF